MIRRSTRRNIRPGVGMCYPYKLPGLFTWLRSDSLITTVGSGVSAWGDLTGNGRGVSQAVSASRPAITVGVGGLPAVTAATVGKFLAFAAGTWSSLTSAEIFLVGRIDASSVFGCLYGIGGTADTAFFTGGTIYDSFGSTLRSASGTVGHEINSPFIYNVSADSSAWTNRLNGSVKTTRGSNVVSWHNSSRLFTTTAADVSIYSCVGDLYEVIAYSRVLSANERLAVNGYLSARYGIS